MTSPSHAHASVPSVVKRCRAIHARDLSHLYECHTFNCQQDISQERPDHIAVELVNGSIRVSYNTGFDTATATIGSSLNDGQYHTLKLDVQRLKVVITVGGVKKDISTNSPGPAQFAGRPYMGGVKVLTPQMRDQLATRENFVGCIKVCFPSFDQQGSGFNGTNLA